MSQRIKRLRAKFKKLNIDAYLVTNPAKIRYLTGYQGTEETPCLITSEEVYLLVTPRDQEQAFRQAKNCKIIIQPRQPELKGIRKQNLIDPCWIIGVEGDVFCRDFYLLRKEYPACGFIYSELINELSATKDKTEIRKIEKALRITEKVYEKHILPQVKPRVTENDLAVEISYWGKKYGAEKDAFDIIVVSGERSCIPHARSSSKKLKKGDIVQFDFGYVVDDYPSDFSRVAFLGEPTSKQKEIYNLVLVAQEAAIKATKPGMQGKDLDRVARDYIKNKGYDIPHGLGHGLGIMIHCRPVISPFTKEELKAGQIITIEPGIYIKGWGGIRLEDAILISKEGCQNLTKFTKEMMII